MSDCSHPDQFVDRHIGPRPGDIEVMLADLGHDNLESLVDAAIPSPLRLQQPLALPAPIGEHAALRELRDLAAKNRVRRSLIGMGYYDTFTPAVIQRNMLENPGWYTQYTPYQSEISQGRLEMLLNFQTMVGDLTGFPVANASLLDEATACAEAMMMCHRLKGAAGRSIFLISENCHPQNIAVVRTRASALGITLKVLPPARFEWGPDVFGGLVQYPDTWGGIHDFAALADAAHNNGSLFVVATDLLALTLIRPPGEFGADIAVGSAQRFGVPLGGGGPHAGFFATRDTFKRQMPGRLVGVSKDSRGKPAYRLSLGTREQHIRREKATSNICTAQALLANMAAAYAIYHGPEGLKRIAQRIHKLTVLLASGLEKIGFNVGRASSLSSDQPPPDEQSGTGATTIMNRETGKMPVLPSTAFFDTVVVNLGSQTANDVAARAEQHGFNLRRIDDRTLGISLDETVGLDDVRAVLQVFNDGKPVELDQIEPHAIETRLSPLARTSPFLTHPVFNRHHSETDMLRYLRRLESRDLSLCHSMIPLGSCTMKLNAAVEMFPVSWPEFSRVHPFAPADQIEGSVELCRQLESWLAEVTGFAAVSLQPNAGAQGEYSGLQAIRAYHRSRGDHARNVCLIPTSAHGTNPASAVMAGMRVVAVGCDAQGNIDVADLKAKAAEHAQDLAALMITYPSTHGVFETAVAEICRVIHDHGGQVYLDGANMNAQVGLMRPADIGADACHLNLHKTFAIPHGGGGPGVGPICVAEHLKRFLPSAETTGTGEQTGVGPVAGAPLGSLSVLPISWLYIRMMGEPGLKKATQVAVLNANYIAKKLEPCFPTLFRGATGLVAHECILDLRRFKATTAEDVAKRLMDFGFHAPTLSWPVAGTLMVEPTESEPLEELNRFCEAMIAIHGEMQAVESGQMDAKSNPLKHAPHTGDMIASETWDRPYSREHAAFPVPSLRDWKFWPAVGRVDNVHGDRNLICSCISVEEAASEPGHRP